jgi:Zn-dependent protease
VALHSNVVTLRYTEDFSFNVSQTLPESFTDTVHVATVQMIGPSLYELKNGPNTEVAALRAAIEHRSRLHAIYGTMKFGLAQNIVTEEFIRAYKSIDILGFTISTHRYPFAILLIAFVTSWGIAWTVEAARRTKKQVLRELHDEDVVDAVLDFPLMRFVIWVLLPALAIWASLPLFPLSSLEQATVIGGTLLMLAISSITWARASQL